MRAAVLRGGSVEARVIDDPVPGPGQLLVRSIPGVLDSIIKGCERGTRIFSVGGPPEGDLLHTLTAKRKGLNIQFGGGPSMTHWDEAFEAVCSGRLDVTPMLGPTVGLDQVPAALDAARDANGPARIVVVP